MEDEECEFVINEAPVLYVIIENILIFAMLIVGFLGMRPAVILGVPIAYAYLLFSVIMLFYVLRRLMCTDCCYFGQMCHCGLGKLSSAVFKKYSGNFKFGGKLASLTLAVIMLLPIVVMLAVIVLGVAPRISELAYLIFFIILVVINGALHKKDCQQCKMRPQCPGSAAK